MDQISYVADYWLKHGLDHLSPTQKINHCVPGGMNMFLKTRNGEEKKKPSAKMKAGISAQIGWDNYVLKDTSEDQSVDLAIKDYQKQKGFFIDDEKEMKQWEVNLEAIPAVVKNYIQALKDLDIKKHNTINAEHYVDLQMDGIEIPWIGRTDLETKEFFYRSKN